MRAVWVVVLLAGCGGHVPPVGAELAKAEPELAAQAEHLVQTLPASNGSQQDQIGQQYVRTYVSSGHNNKGQKRRHKPSRKGQTANAKIQDYYRQMYGSSQMALKGTPSQSNELVQTDSAKRQHFINQYVPAAFRPTASSAASGQPINSDKLTEHYQQMYAAGSALPTGRSASAASGQSVNSDKLRKHYQQMYALGSVVPTGHSASASSAVDSDGDSTVAVHSEHISQTTSAVDLGEAAPSGIYSWRFSLGVVAGISLPTAFAFLKSSRRTARLRMIEESQFHLLA